MLSKITQNDKVYLLLQGLSLFQEKLVINSSYCQKRIVLCVSRKAYYSCFSCHSSKIWGLDQSLSLGSGGLCGFRKTGWLLSYAFAFSLSCGIASVASHMSGGGTVGLWACGVVASVFAWIASFGVGDLGGHLAHWGW